MAQTAAEAAVMESAAGKFESVNESLQGMLTRLMNELQALQSAWQGAGGKSFEQVKQAYEGNQKKLSEALRETATAIRTSGKQYTATDEDARAMVGGINTSVNLPL
ncbi:MAG TPA: WXG100 family type VII secretion target [Micromonosporaceae bacterium]|nr:WXG100 family type VII secretion target [Micromonosporaceae bacterium]HCU51259.1 WXG100 family type VII secretion target [Micromonosporaceae bacterium]